MEQSTETQQVGASPVDGGTQFRVWAPGSGAVEVVVDRNDAEDVHALSGAGEGWFEGRAAGVHAGDRYRLRLDGGDPFPDPLSRYQPEGVHGPSEVVDLTTFPWSDAAWSGRGLDELVIYEVHVGTATPAGTFDGLIDRLPYLAELGVTALELMPVAEFPGERNWGYDGVCLFAPSATYGGPDGLRRLVDAAHGHGLAVLLDVVYNHFGPEGNYLPAISGGRIFTDRHHTPWGAAVNYDDAESAGVRRIVLDNVRQWIRDYHIDGLRLDAAHAIVDTSVPHILQEIGEVARGERAGALIIAEDERNERSLLLPASAGGLGLDGVWADDAHHILRRLTAGDSDGYYSAYQGTTEELARAIRHGWLYQGEQYPPTSQPRGTSSDGIPPQRFVHCIQNHDQVGNRALGERLNHEIGLDVYRTASTLLLLTPCTPLLWMGQEWAATSPFLFFTDHPEELGRLVTRGRREEFKGFAGFDDRNIDTIPDPQRPETFARSRLQWDELRQQPHAGVHALYQALLRLRAEHPALASRDPASWSVHAPTQGAVALTRRGARGEALLLVANFHGALDLSLTLEPLAAGPHEWRLLLHTEQARFGGDDSRVTLSRDRLRSEGAAAVLLESGP